MKTRLAGACACLLACAPVYADTAGDAGHHRHRADSHAPIGVMGDHYHKAGEVMLSYRYMHMSMDGNRDGDDSISTTDIATTVPNRFFGQPGQPPTLRIVPTEMTMDMHMVGAMYAPTDWVTLMLMGSYVSKSMDHVTFQGPAGDTRLGTFTTGTDGIGDTRVSGLFRLREASGSRLHATLGVSVPTGDTTETDRVLTPMNMEPTVRVPYPMQLGSGTWDVITGLTWNQELQRASWGSQWTSLWRTGENDQDYTLGNEHRLTAWLSYLFRDEVSGSLRVEGFTRGNIDGIDDVIVAPVQTADPSRQGADRLDLALGINLRGPGRYRGHRVGLEAMMPVYQDLDGPQLETDWTLTAGYQFAF